MGLSRLSPKISLQLKSSPPQKKKKNPFSLPLTNKEIKWTISFQNVTNSSDVFTLFFSEFEIGETGVQKLIKVNSD